MRCRADGDCVRRRLTLTFGGHSFVCEVIETDVVGTVYCTPRHPQDHAKDIRPAVDRCPHEGQ